MSLAGYGRPEKDGTVSNANRHQPAGADGRGRVGNAQLDWWIIQEIARRIGLNWSYTHPGDVFSEMKQAMPSLDKTIRHDLRHRVYLNSSTAGRANRGGISSFTGSSQLSDG